MSLETAISKIHERLRLVYGARADEAFALLRPILENASSQSESPSIRDDNEEHASPRSRWTERDVVLITYADQLRSPNQSPLATLRQWLTDQHLDELISDVHLLPFFPYSSDDGFSVVDYRQVDPAAGAWDDVARLGERFGLMFDLVLNHASAHSDWFRSYLAGRPPFDRYFIEADPDADLSQVVRPRSSPLLTPFETSRGVKHLWTTFSADQIDLNFAEPQVLAEMLGVLLEYVRRGARIIRLDAVAFLWKTIGANCLHLPQTHEIVKLLRDALSALAPHALLLTETNVPHDENISYFGQGDESQMVYQFSLPPLLLDATVNQDATALAVWLSDLAPPPPGCAFFNFTASHDGVGVRPLEGLVSGERFDRVVQSVLDRGGCVSTRRRPDGTDSPYELNITYVDVLAPDPSQYDQQLHARRFLASQAVMLAVRGMPAVYFHSLVGTRNDTAGVARSGQSRRINRRKFDLGELRTALGADDSLQQAIYNGYRRLLAMRRAQSAFHPDAPQRVVDSGDDAILAFERTSLEGDQRLLVAVNFANQPRSFDVSTWLKSTSPSPTALSDLITSTQHDASRPVQLLPGQAVWLAVR